MAVIKLPNAGDESTFRVAKCEVVESQNIKNPDGSPQEQVKFTAANGDTLFIGRDPADRALARIGFADEEQILYGDVDGWTLKFYRVANKNKAFKPYWNIDKVTNEEHSAPTTVHSSAPKAAPAKPQEATEGKAWIDALDRAYAHGYEVAKAVQGKDATTASLTAGAATLLIAYKDRGLLAEFLVKEEPKKAPTKKAPEIPPPTDADAPDFEADDDLPF